MQDVNVLVTFYSRNGRTERLALAAAVGAVQGRANIRLRRVREVADQKTIESVPGWKENHDRMDKEYVAPRETDALWADAIIMGAPARLDAASPEWNGFVDWLEVLSTQGKLDGKIGAAVTPGLPLYTAMTQLGLITVPNGFPAAADEAESARLQGRKVAEIARALAILRDPR